MDIAVIIPKYGLLGGAESFAYELAERLAVKKEFNIHVFANRWKIGSAPIVYHKVPIIPFPRWIRPVSFAYFANKMIQNGSFDLIHSHDRIFEMDLFTFHGIPHETWIKKTKRKSLSLFDRSMAWVEKKGITNKRMSLIMPVSSLVKEELVNCYNIPGQKLNVIHPGISPDRFLSLDKEKCRRQISKKHGLSSKDVIMLFVSMNFELKRLDLLIKGMAASVLKNKNSLNLKLMVVGKGNKDRYLSIARSLGIAERIVFAGISHEIEKYYLACDMFVMPSMFDTFGIVVLEAMAAGLPVVITQQVGARDLVEPGANGMILSKNPLPSEVAEAINKLTDNRRRRQMGKNGKKVAFTHTWDKTADRVARIYQQVFNKKREI